MRSERNAEAPIAVMAKTLRRNPRSATRYIRLAADIVGVTANADRPASHVL